MPACYAFALQQYFEHLDREEPLLASMDDWVMPSRVSLLLRGIGTALSKTVYTSTQFSKVAREWLRCDGRISEDSGMRYIEAAVELLQPLVANQRALIAQLEANQVSSEAAAPSATALTPSDVQMLVASMYDISIVPKGALPEDVLASVVDASKKVRSVLLHTKNYNYEYYKSQHPRSEDIMKVVRQTQQRSRSQLKTPVAGSDAASASPTDTLGLNGLLNNCLTTFKSNCAEAMQSCSPSSYTSVPVAGSKHSAKGAAAEALRNSLKAVPIESREGTVAVSLLPEVGVAPLERSMEKNKFTNIEDSILIREVAS